VADDQDPTPSGGHPGHSPDGNSADGNSAAGEAGGREFDAAGADRFLDGGVGDGGAADGGLRWSFDFDLESVLAAIGRSLDTGSLEDQEEIQAAEIEALDRDVPDADGARADGARAGVDLAGLIAESLAAGPGLAAWLSQRDPATLSDRDLPGVAASFRRVASWAQAGELAAVAEIAARSAAKDERTGLAEDGRPVAVTRDAAAQVSLGLALSPVSASCWTDLAVTFGWRLRATWMALTTGHVDLNRARIIAEATERLPEEAARAVEAKVLPGAGDRTYSQLRAFVRRAAIAADPEGAEQRREARERQAKVRLYPDADHTASLGGWNLPTVQAAAAMARISAMARALKASGAAGGIDFLGANVFLGLLLGTMPLIPPPPDGPPDADPPEDESPDGRPPDDESFSGDSPGGGSSGGRSSSGRSSSGRSSSGRSSGNADPLRRDGAGSRGEQSGQPSPGGPGTSNGQNAADPGPDGGAPDGGAPDGGAPGGGAPGRGAADSDPAGQHGAGPGTGGPGSPGPGDAGPPGSGRGHKHAPGVTGSPPDGTGPPDAAGAPHGDCADPWPDVPMPVDADAPEEDGFRDVPPSWPQGYADVRYRDDPLDDYFASRGIVPAWPAVQNAVPAAFSAAPGAAAGSGRPAAGLLDLSLPWTTLTAEAAGPGSLGRIGPVTATQARHLARLAAAGDNAAQWRVILTDASGHATAVARMPRLQPGTEPPRAEPPWAGPPGPEPPDPEPGTAMPPVTGLVGRVTVIMPEATVRETASWDISRGGILAAVLRTARRAEAKAREQARADQETTGGCAHTTASAAYRPPPRIREYVTARDLTCRYPFCGQPAWRGDLDHTKPWDQGGLTCSCNLGGLCRGHHILKQHLGWTLTQPRPGVFIWTTPAGRTYTVTPDTQPV
jgi:hypothetical protein